LVYCEYDYGSNELKSDKKTYIRRWRLEPKILWLTPGNWLNQKSLSFIIWPCYTRKLRKYIKQGIEEWQKPFETAGFKKLLEKTQRRKEDRF
jgi:hypothetical protein